MKKTGHDGAGVFAGALVCVLQSPRGCSKAPDPWQDEPGRRRAWW